MTANPSPASVHVTHYRIIVRVNGKAHYVCCPHGTGFGGAVPKMALSAAVKDAELIKASMLPLLLPLAGARFKVINLALDPVVVA